MDEKVSPDKGVGRVQDISMCGAPTILYLKYEKVKLVSPKPWFWTKGLKELYR